MESFAGAGRECVFRGMTRVSDGVKSPGLAGKPGPVAIGVPSAELSLGWLLASRANLRFTRRTGDNGGVENGQEQPEKVDWQSGKSVA
jgi:hypothetical protein